MSDDDKPPACDPEIFRTGRSLLAADTSGCDANTFEAWVRALASRSGQRIDWHYSGGVAHVLFLGDRDAIRRESHGLPCPARVMRWFSDGEPGLYRRGVTPVPPGTLGGYYDGGPGSTFI